MNVSTKNNDIPANSCQIKNPPAGGTRPKINESLKPLGNIVWVPWISVPDSKRIHPILLLKNFTKNQKCKFYGGTRVASNLSPCYLLKQSNVNLSPLDRGCIVVSGATKERCSLVRYSQFFTIKVRKKSEKH